MITGNWTYNTIHKQVYFTQISSHEESLPRRSSVHIHHPPVPTPNHNPSPNLLRSPRWVTAPITEIAAVAIDLHLSPIQLPRAPPNDHSPGTTVLLETGFPPVSPHGGDVALLQATDEVAPVFPSLFLTGMLGSLSGTHCLLLWRHSPGSKGECCSYLMCSGSLNMCTTSKYTKKHALITPDPVGEWKWRDCNSGMISALPLWNFKKLLFKFYLRVFYWGSSQCRC